MTSTAHSPLTELPQFREATHVISGYQLARSGVRMVNVRENFAFGPSHTDGVLHIAKRRAYWRELGAAVGNGRAQLPVWKEINQGLINLRARLTAADSIVFWTTPSLRETTQLAHILTVVREIGVAPNRCAVAVVNAARPSLPIESATHSEMIEPFLERKPLSERLLNNLIALWASFAEDRPAQTLGLLRESGLAAAEEYLLAFPRATATGWSASALDSAILNALPIDGWRPGEALINDPRVDELWVRRGGQWALWLRVSAMIAAGALAVDEGDRNQPSWKLSYRLTQFGIVLRAGGVPQAGQLPAYEIGGHRVDPCRPAWLVGAGGSHLEEVSG